MDFLWDRGGALRRSATPGIAAGDVSAARPGSAVAETPH